MSFFKQRTLLIIALFLLVISVTVALMFNILLQKPYVQRYIMKQISLETGCDVRAGHMAISLLGRPGISLSDVKILAKSRSKSFSALKVRVYFNATKLLQGKLDIEKLFLLQPRITLNMQSEDKDSKSANFSSVHEAVETTLANLPSISVEEGIVQFKNQFFSLKDAEMKIDDKGKLSLNGTCSWHTSNFQFDATGTFSRNNGGNLNAELNVKADHLDFSEIINAQKGFNISDEKPGLKRSNDKPFIASSDIRLRLEADSGNWENLLVDRIEADCAFRNGFFFINQSALTLGKSHFRFKGHVKPDEAFFSGDLKLTKFPIRILIDNFDLELPILEADMSLQGSFNVKGPSTRELIPRLNGAFALQISNGFFEKDSVAFKILNLMNFRRLFSKKHRGLSKKSLPFNSIQGHIDITNGTMALNDFYIKIPLFNAVGRGTINLTDETVDSVIGVQPLGKITDLVEKIPLLGYVLTDGTKSVLTYYFDVEGPVSDPVVKHRPVKKITKGTTRKLKQLFLFPMKKLKGGKKSEIEVNSK